MTDDEDILLKTDRFMVARIEQNLKNGTTVRREIVRHLGSVVVLPLVDRDHICLIRNHRISVDQTLIELPAGTLEMGEIPRSCAVRELAEETGYHAREMSHLLDFYPAPGILDERMHLFVASGLTAGTPQREVNEEIENLVVTWDEAGHLIESNEIQDGKTVIGLLYYLQKQNRT